MSKSRVGLFVLLLGLWLLLQGISLWIGYHIDKQKPASPQVPAAPEIRLIEGQAPVVELLASTPEGVKIYRVKKPELIVPRFIAVAPKDLSVSMQ